MALEADLGTAIVCAGGGEISAELGRAAAAGGTTCGEVPVTGRKAADSPDAAEGAGRASVVGGAVLGRGELTTGLAPVFHESNRPIPTLTATNPATTSSLVLNEVDSLDDLGRVIGGRVGLRKFRGCSVAPVVFGAASG